jgi:hypothetical protein
MNLEVVRSNRHFIARDNDFPRDGKAHCRYLQMITDRLVILDQPVTVLNQPVVDCQLFTDERFQRWTDYIRSLSERQVITPLVSSTVDKLWATLRQSVPKIYPPDASPTDDGTLLMSWIREEHHLEIEVMASGAYIWFYRNHKLNKDYIGEGSPAGDLSTELLTSIGAALA